MHVNLQMYTKNDYCHQVKTSLQYSTIINKILSVLSIFTELIKMFSELLAITPIFLNLLILFKDKMCCIFSTIN